MQKQKLVEKFLFGPLSTNGEFSALKINFQFQAQVAEPISASSYSTSIRAGPLALLFPAGVLWRISF